MGTQTLLNTGQYSGMKTLILIHLQTEDRNRHAWALVRTIHDIDIASLNCLLYKLDTEKPGQLLNL